ncbi:Ig-like domain repeat protein [Candidatus Enterococcus mangumiae]|uniref:Uncharacterized protein n=1 Tax=Candidatus Enterococcus mangumiae TaxID=2230878 RepID=A0ABZ2SZJ9_9ENTE|nr:Ig-like domain repeat protein [Enterococcus sp. DIV1094]MBO0488958.1 Ig-like domain repeat protein [Enterococcus sp. DIV1094]
MKAKKIRVLAASFLLFQHTLLPSTVFAIENEPIASTEIIEEQPESYLSEEQPENIVEEPIVQEGVEQEVSAESAPPETAEVVEEAPTEEEEIPVVEEAPPVVTDEVPTEVSEVPLIDENPLANSLRAWNETPENLTQLTNHGRSSYLESVLQNAINRKITLGTAVNSTTTFSVNVPTHSMVERVNGSNGWISSIVTDSPAGMPDEFYTQMYYGNHSIHNNTYSLSNISSNRSDITISGTVTTSSYSATINITVKRVATSNSTAPVEVRGNVTLGATGVATQYTNIATPRKLTNRTYTNEKIGTLEIDDGRSSAVIGNNIPIEAQRAPVTMPEAEIRSWFQKLPDDPNNYEYSVASPAEGWRPDARGYMDITLRNKTTGVTETHTTNYYVMDTRPPTGTVKSGFTGLFNETMNVPTRSDLIQFMNDDLNDNWTLPDDIKIQLVDSRGWTISLYGLDPLLTHTGYIRLEDGVGNWSNLQEVKFQLRDDQGPTANVTTTPVDFEATRVADLTKEDIMRFFIDGPVDIHTPADKIDISLLDSAGNTVSIKNVAPSTTTIHDATIRLKDEANNQTDYAVKYRVVDTQAPTATFKNEVIDFSTHTSATFSRTDLLRFLTGDPADNWSLPANINIQLVDENDNEFNLSNMEFKEHTGYIRLEDEAGNRSSLQEVRFLAGDTEGPTGNVVTTPVDFQARRKDELTREDLLKFFTEDPLDNVTASDQIDLSLRNNAGDIVSIVNVAPSDTVYDAKIRLQDQANNQTEYSVNYRVIDTEAPTGAVKTVWTLFEANRKEDLSEDDLRKLFSQLEDNWTEAEKIRLQTDFNFSIYAPNGDNAYYPANITAIDELGNSRRFSNAMIRVVDTLPPTASFKDEVIDFSTHSSNTFSRADLLQFFNGTPDDNWTLPENIKIELEDENGNEFALDDMEFKEYTGYIRLTDEHGNQTNLQEVRFLAGDNEGPTGNVVTAPVDFQARRKDELTREDLLRFFTEDPLDNVTTSDQIDLSLRNNAGDIVSIVNVAPSTTVYDAKVRLQDARGNKTEYPVNYRVIDTEAPTGTARNPWTTFEATRERDFTQAELRSLIDGLADNWTELENIQLENERQLFNLEPNGVNEYHHVNINATDEAGNVARITGGMVHIVDTTAPDGTLKDPLVFTKGQEEPAPHEFLDGEPTDNWTLTPNIQVAVAYENNAAFADLEVGTYGVTVTLTDQAGNSRTLNSQVTILEDTSEYIDVTIPMNVSFAESKESKGIVSPTYQIQNNAERPVKVSVSSMVSQADTDELTEIDLGMKNNLNDQEVMLITDGKNLNNRRELGTVEGHSTSFSFSLFGSVGEDFDFESLDDTLNPVYSMRWNFNAQ